MHTDDESIELKIQGLQVETVVKKVDEYGEISLAVD